MNKTRLSSLQFTLATLLAVVAASAAIFGCVRWNIRRTALLTLKEPARVFKAGQPDEFPEVGVYTQLKLTEATWMVRLPENELVALNTFCPGDGCTTNWLGPLSKFKCPCCGSEFDLTGTNISGAAKRALERYKISREAGSIVVDRSVTLRKELGEWGLPQASVMVP